MIIVFPQSFIVTRQGFQEFIFLAVKYLDLDSFSSNFIVHSTKCNNQDD